MTPASSFIEVQFPIGQLSLESYKERKANHAQILKPLGKWWGEKPLVLTRALVLGSVFPAAEDPQRWADDLAIFLKCLTFDNAGMWKRKIMPLPASVCYAQATEDEKRTLFTTEQSWSKKGVQARLALEKRVFYSLGFAEQRQYCCRSEEIDGPPPESWAEINTYLGTHAQSLPELVEELAKRRFGKKLRVGDAFCGTGSIPFEAAELGCDVYAADLNPVACLLAWGALNLIGGNEAFRARAQAEQTQVYEELNDWYVAKGYETSQEGWRAETYLYCLEITVPEWDGWRVPIAPSWVVAPKTQTWVDLIPIQQEKRFEFKIRMGDEGYADASDGTKQDQDITCPKPLWNILRKQGKTDNIPPRIALRTLIANHGGLRDWEKSDVLPRRGDFFQERLYCIKWRLPEGKVIYREPLDFDLKVEAKVNKIASLGLDDWQAKGWVPQWLIKSGSETSRPRFERGWTHWHHLFNPRQLLAFAKYSQTIASSVEADVRPALLLALGKMLNQNARLCGWSPRVDVEKTDRVFCNQALNTLASYGCRGWIDLRKQACPEYASRLGSSHSKVIPTDARATAAECHLWITDPPYADAVNYDELSEFFLAWYASHLKTCFPNWYTDSMRDMAIKGDDAPFRVAMAECYRRLAEKMPDDGLQVLMFTHKDTQVWEDLALIMWAAGLQVKRVWSVSTETPGAGMRVGNYVQSTYNMVLRKRLGNELGFIDFITPQVNQRVREVITHMRESQIATNLAACGYTDTDYLLAAQAVAAEVITGYGSIDGIDLEEELRTPNQERGQSALRKLMVSAKRTATDFLVPAALDLALKSGADGSNAYNFWRSLSLEEKFFLKGLETEAQGVKKIGAFQDLGRAYGLADYEALMGPTKANDTRTKLPEEFPRPDLTRFTEVPPSDRDNFAHSVTRHILHALKLLRDGADMDRAIKHLIDCTNFWQDRHSRHLVLLGYLQRVTSNNPAWRDHALLLQSLKLAIENRRA